MNYTNDFISVLTNNREKIVDKLLQNYGYEYLFKIFSEMNLENSMIKIEPNNKHVYRYLTGIYKNSQYNKSSIDWLPSSELVKELVSLAKNFGINYIEETYAGLGILSSLIKAQCPTIRITASDTFDNPNNCNQLGLINIARRSPSDFKYYDQLNEPYPEMVISSFYPSNGELVSNTNFLEEISYMLQSKKHSVIVIFLPQTYTIVYDIFYHILLDNYYELYTYHVKTIDKYFALNNIMKNIYKTGMLAHIFIRRSILENKEIDEIMDSSIVKTNSIDRHCGQTKLFKIFYDKFNPKLVKSIFKKCDFKKPIKHNILMDITDKLAYINTIGINVPDYIYDTDEFILWSMCIRQNLFFVFDTRMQFYDFYFRAKQLDDKEIRRNINLPEWIGNNLGRIYVYIYLDITNPTTEWKNNYRSFISIWNNICKKNRQILGEKSI